jgi:hypothetical protein
VFVVDVSFEQQLEPAADIVAVASGNKHTSFWDHGPSLALPISTPLSRYCYIRHRADNLKYSYLSLEPCLRIQTSLEK